MPLIFKRTLFCEKRPTKSVVCKVVLFIINQRWTFIQTWIQKLKRFRPKPLLLLMFFLSQMHMIIPASRPPKHLDQKTQNEEREGVGSGAVGGFKASMVNQVNSNPLPSQCQESWPVLGWVGVGVLSCRSLAVSLFLLEAIFLLSKHSRLNKVSSSTHFYSHSHTR